MTQTIEIDDDVFEYLKQEAEPFVDTPNSVLRRVLAIDGAMQPPSSANRRSTEEDSSAQKRRKRPAGGHKKAPRPRKRVPAGSILPEEEYEIPLLQALAEAGGSGMSRDITAAVGDKLDGKLTDLDREPLKSGGIRWENRIQFVRLKMIERGYMDRDTPRGKWAITEAGHRFLAELQ